MREEGWALQGKHARVRGGVTGFILSAGCGPAALPVDVCSGASACVFSLLSGRPPARLTVYVKALSLYWLSF